MEISLDGFKIDFWNSCSILIDISSCPRALLASRDFRMFEVSDSLMSTELKDAPISLPIKFWVP